jgi:hypothetical protein
MSSYANALENFRKRENEFRSDQKLFARFNQQQFVAGPDKAPLAIGSRYVVDFLAASQGHIKFEGTKIVDRRMVALGSAEQAPKREELGDADQSKWELGSDGRSKDPWRVTYEIPTVEVEGEKRHVVFTGSNTGFQIAFNKLFSAICRQVGDNPGKKPLIELSTSTFKGKFGTVPRPEFVLTGWVASGEGTVDDSDFAEDDLNDDPPF